MCTLVAMKVRTYTFKVLDATHVEVAQQLAGNRRKHDVLE